MAGAAAEGRCDDAGGRILSVAVANWRVESLMMAESSAVIPWTGAKSKGQQMSRETRRELAVESEGKTHDSCTRFHRDGKKQTLAGFAYASRLLLASPVRWIAPIVGVL